MTRFLPRPSYLSVLPSANMCYRVTLENVCGFLGQLRVSSCSFALVLSPMLSVRSCRFFPQRYMRESTGNPAYTLVNKSYYWGKRRLKLSPEAKAVSTPRTEMQFEHFLASCDASNHACTILGSVQLGFIEAESVLMLLTFIACVRYRNLLLIPASDIILL
jgi:hypothetical protein